MRKSFLLSLLMIFGFLSSCSEEKFGSETQTNLLEIPEVETFELEYCSNSSTPAIDVLFLYDNSASTNYLASDLKSGIGDLVSNVSTFFDFHVLVAPLIPPPSELSLNKFDLITDSLDGLSPDVIPYIKSANSVNLFGSNTVSTGFENGFQRGLDIINANKANGIFRKTAYTVVILVSNSSDNTVVINDGVNVIVDNGALDAYFAQYQKLTAANYTGPDALLSLQLRFVTIVPQTFTDASCVPDWKRRGQDYQIMSQKIYNDTKSNPPPGGVALSDQDSRAGREDSYDLCSGDIGEIFSNIKTSIESLRKGHKYNYWPVQVASSIDEQDFDPAKIEVEKITFNSDQTTIESRENVPAGGADGWEYTGFSINQNTRYEPPVSSILPAEQVTGFFIKLNGDSRVEYPNCLKVRRSAPNEFFGSMTLTRRPIPETIRVSKNGINIPQDSENGWVYTDTFFSSFNIKITSSTDRTPGSPPLLRSGYLIEFFGDAVFTNEDAVEVFYKPAAIE